MKHTIDEMANKIRVMHEKAEALRTATNNPFGKPDKEIVTYAIEDIQALAREIANDRD